MQFYASAKTFSTFGHRAQLGRSRKFFQLIMLSLAFFWGATATVADTPAGLKEMLTTALQKGDRATFETLFQTALETWPDDRIDILKVGREVNPDWMEASQLQELDTIAAEAEAAEAAQRARGVWYYLDPVLWDGQIQLGANVSSGDTDQQAGTVGIAFKRDFGPDWEHAFDFKFDFARRSGETVQERFVAQYDGLWRAWEKGFVANFTQLEIDRFSGFDYRLTETLSVGYQLLDTDRHKLRIEAGPGFRLNKIIPTEEELLANPDFNENQTEIIGRLASTYDFKISEAVSFNNGVSAIFGSEFTSLRNVARLSTKLTSHLAFRLSFEANFDSPVPEGTSEFDTITRATIAYDF